MSEDQVEYNVTQKEPMVLTPRKALNKAFLKAKPGRAEIEQFKGNLSRLLDQINEGETEEFHKNLVSRFLRETYYAPEYSINTKGRTDLVIHNGKKSASSVGVIIEAKSPTNKGEMVHKGKLNTKAFQELLLYYLRERIGGKNLEIKYLIATNIYEWFVFDAAVFEKLFAQNKDLVKQYEDFETKRLSGTTTDFFYSQIASPAIEAVAEEIPYTHFDIRDYEKPLRNNDRKDDNKLIALFKLFSPEHLLKLPFANDSNTLDRTFYSELLHIIGLAETKQGGKKLIGRKTEGQRNPGSLIESTIMQLDTLGQVSRLDKPSRYGDTYQEQLFNAALELVITWMNRVLFLKLLEGRLLSYHQGDEAYTFLNSGKVKNYDDLNALFFQVLARRPGDRNPSLKDDFGRVPYLNSSLFEPTETESRTIFVSNLQDELTLPLLSTSVLKDDHGKRRKGEMVTLDYLFAFLNAYDFSSEGSEEVQEDNKTLINASVLGLIFEKINGYKDGSFFTPGFITMYMCRETIRKAVVQKFKDRQGLEGIKNLDDIYNAIGRDISAGQANEAINSLKICDPAVGSGHFLVSALNEIIAIKSELGILMDRQGQRRLREHVEVVNDELVITDDEGALFEYHTHSPESRRVQEALFHEKQTLIENCLFGVDINPNSVKICRLRLWIELLKNAYYKAGEPGGNGSLEELETLPNIDINIKSGNSLISRFPLDADLGQALKKSKWNIESYRRAVQSYREAHDKEQKREMEALINDIKSDFRTEISSNDPKVKRLSKLNGELYGLVNQQQMFELNKTEKKARKKKIEKLEKDVNKLSAEVEEIRSNRIYENAFEWRFEFPEVLGEDGEFVGFDVVIGNPPYIRAEEIGDQKSFFKTKYLVFVSAGDIFSYFYEMSHRILRENGKFCFINNTFAKTNAGRLLRSFVTDNFTVEKYLDFTSVVVFEEATTYPIVFLASKVHNNGNDFKYLKVDESVYSEKENLSDNSLFVYLPQKTLRLDVWSFKNHTEAELLLRLGKFKSLGSRYGKSYRGIITGLNEAFVINNMICENSVLKPVYDGKDLKKWSSPPPSKWMIVIESKSTKQSFGELDEVAAKEKMQEVYPEIFAHLEPHELNAKKRYDKGNYWWELRNCAYYDLFAKPKIVFPNLQNSNKFAFDDTGTYLNAPSVFLSTEDKALLGILNSKLIWYYLTSICVVRNGGYIEVKPQYFEQIPIPDISDDLKDLLTGKVNLILAASKNDPGVDASTLEKEIDQLVYGLYGLSEEEIGVVEGSV